MATAAWPAAAETQAQVEEAQTEAEAAAAVKQAGRCCSR